MNTLIQRVLLPALAACLLSLSATAFAGETLLAQYFDIKTGSAAGTEVVGKVNLLSNKDAHKTPVPADYTLAIASDPSNLFQIVNQRDAQSRLFGALRVKAGQTVPAAPADYPLTVALQQRGVTLATASFNVRALAQTQLDKMLAYTKAYCVNQDRLFGRARYAEAEITRLIVETETNGGRFSGYEFYTRPITDYLPGGPGTGQGRKTLSTQWQEVASKIGGLGFAYQNVDSKYPLTYGPNGTPANHERLKNALYAALREYIDKVPIDPAQVVINGSPIGGDYGDGIMRLWEKKILSYNDTTHSWIWTDAVTGPAVWLQADLLNDIARGDAAAKALHESLVRFLQIGYGLPIDNREVNDPSARWGQLVNANYTEGAFADANHFHRLRGWLALPTIWADYNRPITYVPYWYDGYFSAYPGFQLRPGWSPRGSLQDLRFWTTNMLVPAHLYPQSGFHPDGMITHHFDDGVDGRAMWAYGYEWMVAPIDGNALFKRLGLDVGGGDFNLISSMYLYTYDKLIYRGEIDAALLGRSYLGDVKKFTAGMPATINQMIAARPATTPIDREQELVAWGAALKGGTQQSSGNFPFWVGNYMVHRKGGQAGDAGSYMFSVVMGNDAMGATDDFDDPPKLFHASSGLLFARTAGTEYALDARKRWDWHALPGLTEELRTDAIPGDAHADQIDGSAYAGTASDGVRGFAAMHYRPADTQTYASARADKAWFFPGDEAIALGSGIARRAAGQGRAILTTLDQTRWVGNLTYSIGGGAQTTVTQGATLDQTLAVNAPSWFHQGRTGYFVFPTQAQQVRIRGGSAIVPTDTDADPAVNLIHLAIDHGTHPQAANYHYEIVPNIGVEQMPARLLALQERIKVVANDEKLQGIYDRGTRTLQLAFHAEGAATWGAGMTVTVDQPALIQLHDNGTSWDLSASDPIHDLSAKELNITLSVALKPGMYEHVLPGIVPRAGKPISVTRPSAGVSHIRVPLPDADDGPSLGYQEALYANVPIRVSIPVDSTAAVAPAGGSEGGTLAAQASASAPAPAPAHGTATQAFPFALLVDALDKGKAMSQASVAAMAAAPVGIKALTLLLIVLGFGLALRNP